MLEPPIGHLLVVYIFDLWQFRIRIDLDTGPYYTIYKDNIRRFDLKNQRINFFYPNYR